MVLLVNEGWRGYFSGLSSGDGRVMESGVDGPGLRSRRCRKLEMRRGMGLALVYGGRSVTSCCCI